MASSAPPSLHAPPSMDNDSDTEPPSFDVGVAIAKKKKAQQQQHNDEKAHPSTVPKNPNTSLQDFLYGASLYGACLAIPALLGLTARFFDYQEQPVNGMHPREQTYYEQASDYICENVWSYWCYSKPEDEVSSVHAPDAEWTDVGIVAALSLSMAMIRLLLVHLLVPRYLAPKRLEALVRCKSVHLLSSSYPKSLTPQNSKRKLSVGLDTIPPPPLYTEEEQGAEADDELSSSLHGVKQSLERYIPGWRSAFSFSKATYH